MPLKILKQDGNFDIMHLKDDGFSHDIPTTLHRNKADCPVPEVYILDSLLLQFSCNCTLGVSLDYGSYFLQEMVTISVDGSVLERIAIIMSYLRLGSSGKAEGVSKHQAKREILPPPPPLRNNHLDLSEKQGPAVARAEEEDIFLGEGIDYAIPISELRCTTGPTLDDSRREGPGLDFGTEEDWATYNEQKEAMPKAAFQFGVKILQDGHKTRKQNKDQKITNELHEITRSLQGRRWRRARSIMMAVSTIDDLQPGKLGIASPRIAT
ncbi:hypothetical protein HHK36_014458 [Tetracentron sinense]|uniref:Uncharacterized protein n=1 Tax=Tetracentron sinense TaxID=13715 RepID=A0A834Z433_TETSI|nr:hypothetical protein HHK36_014458 [Tetracentron sinense]